MIERSPIPDGWETVRLEDVAEVNPRRRKLDISAQTSVTFLPMTAIAENCRGILEREMRPYNEVSTGYTYFENEDTLIAKITPCLENGKHVLATGLELGFGFGTTEFHVVRACNGIAPRYLFRVLVQPHNLERYAKNFTGTAGQQRVQPDALKSTQFFFPPLREQLAIADILDSIDESIESVEALIAATEQVRDSLLDELLTRGMPGWHMEWREVPGIGTVPASWDVVRLGEVAEVIGGSTPSRNRSEYWGGDIPWVVPSELTGLQSRYLTATNDSISRKGMKAAGLRILPIESILVTSRATIGVAAMNQFPVTTNQGFKSLIAKPGTDPCWIYYMISSRRSELERKATGSTFGEIGARAIRQLLVALPSLNEQHAIAKLLDNIDIVIKKQRKELETQRLVKASAANALLTGRARTNRSEKMSND